MSPFTFGHFLIRVVATFSNKHVQCATTGRGTRERLEETPEQAAARMDKLCGAVRTILECVGEDPDREGLRDTPARYAKAMMFFTEGYQQNVLDIVNNAIFQEGHDEMVIVKDIDIFSVCEHHLVPFTGKVTSSPQRDFQLRLENVHQTG